MKIIQSKAKCHGIKFIAQDKQKKELGRASLYIMHNDLHKEPFGFMEDVYIAEEMRGQGLGTSLVKQVIKKAKEMGCYKLIATSRYSRPKVHDLYIKLGFLDHGKEFRIDFN